MPVIVPETGTGSNPLANSYIDEATALAYHADRNNAAWASASAGARQSALINATEYLDYAYRWKGQKLSSEQPLAWPRDLLNADPSLVTDYNVNEIPQALKAATAVLALHALTGPLMPQQTGGQLTSESVSVGGAVTRSRTYAGGGADPSARRFPFVDNLVSRYAMGTGGVRSSRIERA